MVHNGQMNKGYSHSIFIKSKDGCNQMLINSETNYTWTLTNLYKGIINYY